MAFHALTYQQIVGLCRGKSWLLLVLEHGIVVGGVTPHNAAAAAVAVAIAAAIVRAVATVAAAAAAAIARQRQQGNRFALLLLLVVEVQQRVEWQRQTGGAFRAE